MEPGALTVDALREQIAAKTPTPGGGTVVGMCGSLAAALSAMVARFSSGRAGHEQHESTYSESIEAFDRASSMFAALASEDAQAYRRLSELLTLPKDDPRRGEAMPDAVREAVRVPVSVMGLCVVLLRRYEALAPIANRWLLSDLAIACELTAAVGYASGHLVRANASLLAAHAPDDTSARDAAEMVGEIAALRETVLGLCGQTRASGG